jgi:ribonucleoside-diphosphate reductase alpha chain
LSIDGPIHGKTNGKMKAAAKSGGAAAKPVRAAPALVQRRYTTPGVDPLDQVAYELRDSVISNPDGSVVFACRGAEIPRSWSQLATDIAVSKYFRRAGLHGDAKKGETSARQLVYRVAHTIREAGESRGYFRSAAEADTFEAELAHMLITQVGAFNSPVWFNCGLFQRYGIEGSGGNWAWSDAQGTVAETANAYEAPQCSACFIQSANDDLMSIFELVKNEARLFKYGSGTGSNFSALRGRQEKLSGGGTSSGLMSFLEVFDRAAGSTKSGGTTRRAAKMVCLDMDHPEIVDFIEWKSREEKKAQALIAAGYPADFNGEAYHTVSGQNSNNSVRVTEAFMQAVVNDGTWETRARTTGKCVDKIPARELWTKVAKAAWACADPGVQYDSTINDWHTCPNSGRINASNPCSEYMFLDDTACNLSSLNLTKFLVEGADGSLRFDIEGYRHAARVFFLAQEILVDYSSYPTKAIAQNSHDYRPLGLGYANLGTLLMVLGIAYDSPEGRSMAAALTAILTGQAYRVSAEVAGHKGPFAGYARNREPMLRVMRKHRDAAYAIDAASCPADLFGAAKEDWDEAVRLGEQYGYRNAQATVLAPTGTIGLLMDCDTTGIEPDFALVKFKKLAGGGYFKIVNASVERALGRLGYSKAQIAEILAYVVGTNTFLGAPVVNREYLKGKGFTNEDITRLEGQLPGAFTVEGVFSAFGLGADLCKRLGLEEAAKAPGWNLLAHWGLTRAQIDLLGDTLLGRMTVEGAPHLRDEHLPVFDCANRCGKHGTRYLKPMSHVQMMAAVQPFLSGAISKTVNLPNDATVDEVMDVYTQGWKLGLKAVALYRDGCKASQPLSTSGKDDKTEKEDKAKGEAEVRAAAAAAAPAAKPVTIAAAPTPVATGSDAAAEFGPLFAKGAVLSPQRQTVRYRLPKKRRGFTQEAKIGGHKVFLRTGEYEDGQLGEIFIDMHKEGAAFRSLMNSFAIAVSMGLQHGVSLAEYVDQFTFTRFEPQGAVEGHANVKFATSIIDYVFRVLGVEYLKRYEFAHVPPEDANTSTGEGSHDVTSSGLGTQSAHAATTHEIGAVGGSALDQQLGKMMGDAPFCDNCGHITVRNGACYRCLNCGNSMGCS